MSATERLTGWNASHQEQRECTETRSAQCQFDLTSKLGGDARLHSEILLALTEGSPDIVFVVGRDGNITYINRAGVTQLHETEERLLGTPIASFFPKAGSGDQVSCLKRVISEGQPCYCEGTWQLSHGDRWVGTWFAPLRDVHGNVVAVLGVARDLTVRRNTELALRESEERYRRLVELVPYGVFVHKGGRIVFVNTAGVELLGARRHDELIGRSYLDFVPAELLKVAKERINHVLELGARTPFHESQFVRLDGTRVTVEEVSVPFEFDGEPAVQVIARDITETKRLADALEQSRARFEKIFRAGPAAMWLVTAAEARVIDANDAFLEMLGYKADEILGRTVAELGIWNEPSAWYEFHNRLRRQGIVHGAEAVFAHKSGRVKNVVLSVESLRFPMGPCFLFVALDITERVQLEEQLRESQKAEAIGQLARGVAHDFNNILTIIHGHARLMRLHHDLSVKALESLTQIEEAAVRAANLTKQLLAFGRKHPMQPKVVNLNDVIQSVIQMLRRSIGEDIVLEFKPCEPLWPVMVDVGMLEQVLVNLAINARDAMPKGGRLAISTSASEIDRNAFNRPPECEPGIYVCISVEDSGEGIRPEILPRIFEPFFTTKGPGRGTGLGLATVRSIVRQHKGWVEVDSQVGRGTTFRVFLPAVRSACPRTYVESTSTVMPTGRETILVVEDEEELRELCREILERCGYKVLTAANGQEALQVWQRRHGKVDLLVSDVIMPGGIDGWELAQSLATQSPSLKVILTSGYRFDATKSRSSWFLRWRLLEKPYVPEALAQAVRESLDAR